VTCVTRVDSSSVYSEQASSLFSRGTQGELLRQHLAERDQEVAALEDRALAAEAACAYAVRVLDQFECNRNAQRIMWTAERGRHSSVSTNLRARQLRKERRLGLAKLELADAQSQLRQTKRRCAWQLEALDDTRQALATTEAEVACCVDRNRDWEKMLLSDLSIPEGKEEKEGRGDSEREGKEEQQQQQQQQQQELGGRSGRQCRKSETTLSTRCAELEMALDRANSSTEILQEKCDSLLQAATSAQIRSRRIAAYAMRRACRAVLAHGFSCWMRAVNDTTGSRSLFALFVLADAFLGPSQRGLRVAIHQWREHHRLLWASHAMRSSVRRLRATQCFVTCVSCRSREVLSLCWLCWLRFLSHVATKAEAHTTLSVTGDDPQRWSLQRAKQRQHYGRKKELQEELHRQMAFNRAKIEDNFRLKASQ
jgi:hypothetical protein